jgi:hypothetical protein
MIITHHRQNPLELIINTLTSHYTRNVYKRTIHAADPIVFGNLRSTGKGNQ